MKIPEPSPEHLFLLQLVGDWDIESECRAGADAPPSKSLCKQSTRALGEFWTLGEMESTGTDGKLMQSLMTLGFDPARGKFVGSFVASCMTYHWLYEGTLDTNHRVLTLDAEGPSFAGDGRMAKYHDIIEVVNADVYLFSSEYQDAQGNWIQFMNGTHTRRK